jgi:hypothetical protein
MTAQEIVQPPELDVSCGSLSQLRADRGFGRVARLG